jgi:ubiquinone/menaquinone biosynthesis C-methylase UbiE
MEFKDLFSGYAQDYKTFRPAYPRALFEYLASLSLGHDLAWDCATGNGQAAAAIKPFFRQVIATDASQQQLGQAEQVDGISYQVAPAEQSEIASGSVDLTIVAQALHWFAIPQFFAEVERVSKPDAIVACWCYSLMTISPPIDALVWQLYEERLGNYWPSERRLIEQQYRTISFPFQELTAPTFQMSYEWTFPQVIGYLNTWSALHKYQQAQGVNPLTSIGDALLEAWGDPAMLREVQWPIHLRVGRV